MCKVELMVCRVKGALISYIKHDSISGHPIEHSHHEIPPSELYPISKKFNDISLTLQQKQFVIEKYGKLPCDDIVIQMRNHTKCTEAQAKDDNAHLLKKAVQNYTQLKTTKTKYISKSDGNLMSLNELKCLLDVLTDVSSRADESPKLGTGDVFKSAVFQRDDFNQQVWKHIRVVEHDVGVPSDKGFTFILLEYVNSARRAELIVKSDLGPLIQLEMDFFKLVNNDGWQVGHIGTSDLNHRYWLLGSILCLSENTSNALKLLSRGEKLIEAAGGLVTKGLIDGGKALISAVEQSNASRTRRIREGNLVISNDLLLASDGLLEFLEIFVRRCFAHIVRMPNTRGGGKRGSKGSLARYLLETGIPPKTVSKVSDFSFVFRSWSQYISHSQLLFRLSVTP